MSDKEIVIHNNVPCPVHIQLLNAYEDKDAVDMQVNLDCLWMCRFILEAEGTGCEFAARLFVPISLIQFQMFPLALLRFSLVKEQLIEFNQLAMANAEGHDDMLNRVMTKDNIGLAALLETKKDVFDHSGE